MAESTGLNAIIHMSAPGDKRAQAEFIRLIHDPLTQYLTRKFGSEFSDDDIQEAMQQAILDMILHAKDYRGSNGDASAWEWVYTIARNRAYKWIRTRKREIPWSEESDDDSEIGADRLHREIICYNPNLDTNTVEETIEEKLFLQKAKEIKQQLTPREKLVVELIEAGYNQKEIAATIRVRPPRVTQIMQSIRLKFLSAAG